MSVPAYNQVTLAPFMSISQFDSVDAGTNSASTAATADGANANPANSDHKSFWANLWDVINPLEHLPIVSTIYDEITHNKVGDVEKIAGDTLYGGFTGLVSSIANVAFTHVTGKSLGETVWDWVTGDDDSKASSTVMADTTKPSTPTSSDLTSLQADPITTVLPVAQPTVAQIAVAAPKVADSEPKSLIAQNQTNDNTALIAALQRSGMNSDMQARALEAYRRTMNMNTSAATATSTIH